MRRCGEIGRHKGLKIPRSNIRTGSSPVSGTKLSPANGVNTLFVGLFCLHNECGCALSFRHMFLWKRSFFYEPIQPHFLLSRTAIKSEIL